MKIAVGCDHTALDMKRFTIDLLREKGHEPMDFGTVTEDSCDYPDIAVKAARAVASGDCELGVLICGTGLGMSYTANKVRDIRAACVSEPISAALAREHNDANVLCFGARIVGKEVAKAITLAFVETGFSGSLRHQRRIDMISDLERL